LKKIVIFLSGDQFWSFLGPKPMIEATQNEAKKQE
jgi:hypothetical protein